MLAKGLEVHQGEDVPRRKKAGPRFPASVTAVPWEAAVGGQDTVWSSLLYSVGKAGLRGKVDQWQSQVSMGEWLCSLGFRFFISRMGITVAWCLQ